MGLLYRWQRRGKTKTRGDGSTPGISAEGGRSQGVGGQELEANLGYIATNYAQKLEKKKENKNERQHRLWGGACVVNLQSSDEKKARLDASELRSLHMEKTGLLGLLSPHLTPTMESLLKTKRTSPTSAYSFGGLHNI